jgi:hypothetical protein
MKVVLSIVDPEYPNNITIEEIAKDRDSLKAAIKLAERNGLYYYFIYRLKELEVDIPSTEKNRWKEENQKLSELKETISLLNSISNDYEIDFILIKACNTIPHVPRDVDIFVNKEKRKQLLKAFESIGMNYDQKSAVEASLKKEGYLRIDVYSEISYFTVNFLKENFLWESVTKNKMLEIEYPCLSNEAEFLLSLVHNLFAHRSMSLLDFLHMKSLRNVIDVDACKQYAYKNRWGSVFDLAVKELDVLYEKIYKEGEVIRFRYIFGRNLIMDSISTIEGLNLSKLNKMALNISLVIDGFRESQRDSALYNLLKSFEPTRKFINYSLSFVKAMRGDKKW